MPQFTRRTVHDVAAGSNLDLILRAANGIGNRLVDAIWGGLRAIALALSTPQDNSTEVQKHIDQVTKRIASQEELLQGAVDNQKGK